MPDLMTENKFRSSLYGYNRDDVVNYLDKMSRSHAAEVKDLHALNDQLRSQLEQKTHQLELVTEQLEAASCMQADHMELERAKEENLELRQSNEKLQRQIATLEQDLELARSSAAEVTQIQAEPEQIIESSASELSAPMAEVADAVPETLAPSKDYTELELAAYRRAELAERLARERAADVYRQVQSVFTQANTKMDTRKADLEQMTKALQGNVRQLLAVLAGISDTYTETELSFEQVHEKNQAFLAEQED